MAAARIAKAAQTSAKTVQPGGKLTRAVRESLENLQVQPEDAGLCALVTEYAVTMDGAAAIAAQVAKLPFDPDTADAVEQLRKRVSAQVTMSDLGPKLLAALDALGATPKARATGGKPAQPATSSRLAVLRGGA